MAAGCRCFLDYLAVVTGSLYLYCSYCPRDNESIVSIVLRGQRSKKAKWVINPYNTTTVPIVRKRQ